MFSVLVYLYYGNTSATIQIVLRALFSSRHGLYRFAETSHTYKLYTSPSVQKSMISARKKLGIDVQRWISSQLDSRVDLQPIALELYASVDPGFAKVTKASDEKSLELVTNFSDPTNKWIERSETQMSYISPS